MEDDVKSMLIARDIDVDHAFKVRDRADMIT